MLSRVFDITSLIMFHYLLPCVICMSSHTAVLMKTLKVPMSKYKVFTAVSNGNTGRRGEEFKMGDNGADFQTVSHSDSHGRSCVIVGLLVLGSFRDDRSSVQSEKCRGTRFQMLHLTGTWSEA